MKSILSILVLLTPAIVLAAGGEHGGGHHDAEIPKAVVYQAINVAILVAGIIYFTKDSIVQFFSERKTAYLAAAQKSAQAREQAEKEFVDIKNKLASLDTTRDESIKNAMNHAEDIKKQILAEANQVAQRIQEEAQLTARLEISRAQKELREQLLKDSIEAARVVLTKDIGAADQQKLQKDFINNIGV